MTAMKRTKTNGCILQQERFRLDMKENIIVRSIVKHWDGLPGISCTGCLYEQVSKASIKSDTRYS